MRARKSERTSSLTWMVKGSAATLTTTLVATLRGKRYRALPLALRAVHGEVSKTRWTRISYALFRPLLPLVRAIAPDAVISTEELGRAVIRAARQGGPKRVLEARDLRALGAP
jgi:hypothetical protein